MDTTPNLCENCQNYDPNKECCLDDYFDVLDDNDAWFLSDREDDDSLIVRVADRYFLWAANSDLIELVKTPLTSPIDFAEAHVKITS